MTAKFAEMHLQQMSGAKIKETVGKLFNLKSVSRLEKMKFSLYNCECGTNKRSEGILTHESVMTSQMKIFIIDR